MSAAVHQLRPSFDPREASAEELRIEDAALVASLKAGHPNAPAKLFDRYGAYVERLLVRVLGDDPDLEDVLHEVFAAALENIGKLRDGGALRAWLTRITVCSARTCIRRRTRMRWLSFRPSHDVPEVADMPSHEAREVVDRVYRVLEKLKADDRIAFVLREVHRMTLEETAEACGVSLATAKRRIARGRTAFMAAAEDDPVLSEWMKEVRS